MMESNVDQMYMMENGTALTDPKQSQVMALLKSIRPEQPQQNSTPYEMSEMGMSELFAECYENDIKYCVENKTWYSYDGVIWRIDHDGLLVHDRLCEFVRLFTLYVMEIHDENKRKIWLEYCAKMNDRRLRTRIIEDAKSKDIIRINIEQFDSDPMLINCENGTFDLEKMRFRAHDWRDFLTMKTRVSYTAETFKTQKVCERWVQFVDEVTEGDKPKADYLQRALGYSLLGSSKEECMFILYGKTTRNGKSTMLNTVENLLGDYACVSPVSIICQGPKTKDASAANPVLAGLKSRRMVTMSESNQYGKLDEEAIKQMTGGERISTRQLYGKQFEFIPQFTMFLSCNDLPNVTDRSVFASERLRVVEFNRHFTQEEQDKTLKEQFEEPEAMRGIFKWLLDGYKKYRKNGLTMTAEMQKIVREYEKDNDVVLQFLIDRTEKVEDSRVKLKNLYENYKLWAKSNGYHVMSSKTFAKNVETHWDMYDGIIIPGNVKTYTGIRMREG